MKSGDMFKPLATVTTARPPFRKQNDIEVDDTAPIPLFIGIGLPVFIGFIILVLICCFCRRRRSPNSGANANQAVNTNYHRAPEADGMGPGTYPMTAVVNSYGGYPVCQPIPPGHYTPVPPGVCPPMHPAYPSQQVPPPAAAHFAAIQSYPPHQYMPIIPPPAQAHQSLSHSSQASSGSAHTVDPLVQSSSPSAGVPPQHIMQQQQQFHLQQQQQHLYHHHQSSGLSRESPAPFHYAPSPFMIVQGTEHNTIIATTSPATNVSQTLISSPVNSKPPPGQTAMMPLKDDGTDQDLGYSEGEE